MKHVYTHIALSIIILLFLGIPTVSVAMEETDIFDAPCRRFGVPKRLVIAIAKTESSLKPWVVNVAGKDHYPKTKQEALHIIHDAKARGLSHDIGIMQINNWWLKKLHISSETALEPINNITLGVWILAQEIRRHGYNWKAVGAYHSPTLWRQQAYAKRVARYYQQ